MKYITYILLFLPFIVLGQAETVTIASTNITLEDTETGFDLTSAGKWEIQFKQDDWIKHKKTLYPVKTDRTAAVITAQAAVKTELNKYIKEALENGFYTVQGEGVGLVLSAQTSFTYIGVCFKDGEFCEIITRQNNKQYILNLYPTLTDESSAATTARANIVTQLAIIDVAADAGSFYK